MGLFEGFLCFPPGAVSRDSLDGGFRMAILGIPVAPGFFFLRGLWVTELLPLKGPGMVLLQPSIRLFSKSHSLCTEPFPVVLYDASAATTGHTRQLR